MRITPTMTEYQEKLRVAAFEAAVSRVKRFAVAETQKSAQKDGLFYHNRDHIEAVRRRALRIFEAIIPCLDLDSATATRWRHLLEISALAHDMIQEFLPPIPPEVMRRREPGSSEWSTIVRLVSYMEQLNQEFAPFTDGAAPFTETDIQLVQEAIEATICLIDPEDSSIYQPLLYNTDRQLSPISRVLALADLGGLGMEGIGVYQQEGSLIFLEENQDMIPLIWNDANQCLVLEAAADDLPMQERYEFLRKCILRRTRFQIAFVRGRLNRFEQEVSGFSSQIIDVLRNQIFTYLTPETIQTIEHQTPTADTATLGELLGVFQLEKYLKSIRLHEYLAS